MKTSVCEMVRTGICRMVRTGACRMKSIIQLPISCSTLNWPKGTEYYSLSRLGAVKFKSRIRYSIYMVRIFDIHVNRPFHLISILITESRIYSMNKMYRTNAIQFFFDVVQFKWYKSAIYTATSQKKSSRV